MRGADKSGLVGSAGAREGGGYDALTEDHGGRDRGRRGYHHLDDRGDGVAGDFSATTIATLTGSTTTLVAALLGYLTVDPGHE